MSGTSKIRYSALRGNLYILVYLNTTDEAVEVKKAIESIPPCHCIAGDVIVFVVPIWLEFMSRMIVFTDLEVCLCRERKTKRKNGIKKKSVEVYKSNRGMHSFRAKKKLISSGST